MYRMRGVCWSLNCHSCHSFAGHMAVAEHRGSEDRADRRGYVGHTGLDCTRCTVQMYMN